MVVAGLAPAMPDCTIAFIRQQSPAAAGIGEDGGVPPPRGLAGPLEPSAEELQQIDQQYIFVDGRA